MRRKWMGLLVVPVLLALALPTMASATPTTPARPAASARPAAPSALSAWTEAAKTHRFLRYGMRNQSVKGLQERLAALKYYPGSIDGQFGTATQEAVWAFQETQGLPGESYVDATMWRDLANPRAPRVLVPHGGGDRIEINLSDEVLVLYDNNHIRLVSHVSTGGGYYFCSPGGGCGTAITPTGNYHTLSFLPGWVTVPLGYMYNPVFFIGTAYAIHGDIPVPLQPVSHGCVRIPMDIAAFFHTLVQVPGEPVYLRG
jgi:peptidoglycan hydrolase-like protein with peptidoglycan-binding domain